MSASTDADRSALSSRMAQWFLSLLIFSLVFGIAMSNPMVRERESFQDQRSIPLLSRVGLQKDSRTSWQSFSKHRDGLISRNHDLQSFVAGIQVTNVTTSSIARSSPFSIYVLPFQLPRWFLHCQWIIPVYFMFAVFYDIYHITRHYLH